MDPTGPGGAVIRTCTISANGSSIAHIGGSDRQYARKRGVDVPQEGSVIRIVVVGF